MAQLTCSSCGLVAEDGDLICRGCLGNLSRPVSVPPATSRTAPAAESAAEAPATSVRPMTDVSRSSCPHCGADIPVPTNRVCVVCQRLLPEAGPTPAPKRHSGVGKAHATRRDALGAVLRIRLDKEEFAVTSGNTLLLGRDASAYRTGSLLERYDNVSRRHATLGVEADGTAWVRDEHSTNGTFINAAPLRPGVRAPLRDGDTLRLAADCTLEVVLGRSADQAEASGR